MNTRQIIRAFLDEWVLMAIGVVIWALFFS